MFNWAGIVKDYQVVSAYHPFGVHRTEFHLDGVEEFESAGSKEAQIIMRFADYEVAPGATFGTVSTDSGNPRIEVELPLDWLQTFWRAIDHIQNREGLLIISANDQNAVTKVAFSVVKGAEGLEDHSRRERLDTFMRQLEAADGS
jgi:hypothetical protein